MIVRCAFSALGRKSERTAGLVPSAAVIAAVVSRMVLSGSALGLVVVAGVSVTIAMVVTAMVTSNQVAGSSGRSCPTGTAPRGAGQWLL